MFTIKNDKQCSKKNNITSLIEKFATLSNNKIEYLKKLNKPTMGWFSIYTPEEIIYAAGIIPFRVTGEKKPVSIKSRAILSGNMCPYVLSCLEEGIQGTYNSLAGVVVVNTCDARRRVYDAWKMYVKTPFIYMIDLPKIITSESKSYFKNQFFLFKKAIEDHFKCKITEKSLKQAIVLWNKTRHLLSQFYELRKNKNLLISGSMALTIVKAAMAGDKNNFNKLLYNLLKEINNLSAYNKEDKRQRILITGSYFDHFSLIELIEELGVDVVCEDLSNGLKYFEGKVDINKEPIEALADHYLEKAPCARMINSEKRFNHILKTVKDYNAGAVIYFALKFCDSNLIDFPYQKERLNQNGIPILFIEAERTLVNLRQIKTRIEAFLEMKGKL